LLACEWRRKYCSHTTKHFCLFQKRRCLVLPRWSKSWLYCGDFSYVQWQLSGSLVTVVHT